MIYKIYNYWTNFDSNKRKPKEKNLLKDSKFWTAFFCAFFWNGVKMKKDLVFSKLMIDIVDSKLHDCTARNEKT